ncbi:MAG: peptidoglycan-binding protein [Hyphomicrobium sp.]|nr:peptidoglycan-binding protein [Hyphomicrobium sp.]
MSRGRGQTNGLDAPQTKELQQILARRGYDVGKIDGLAGAKTRAAVKDMQMKLGFPADSYATPELLAAPPPQRLTLRLALLCHPGSRRVSGGYPGPSAMSGAASLD